ncbi:MAG: hypothetical protein J3Q66DRAFT_407910 [Benniella sp.]|nr:MAG: hypothetical protein J3Q66DRAFT_407910 [Benniella sp.]
MSPEALPRRMDPGKHLTAAPFDSSSDEGFTMNDIEYLKILSVTIFKDQGGPPVVDYSRFNDDGTWKTALF